MWYVFSPGLIFQVPKISCFTQPFGATPFQKKNSLGRLEDIWKIMQLSAHSRDLLDSSRYKSPRHCSLQVVPMGAVGLLLVYHIFDIIRERISHMDDGEKDETRRFRITRYFCVFLWIPSGSQLQLSIEKMPFETDTFSPSTVWFPVIFHVVCRVYWEPVESNFSGKKTRASSRPCHMLISWCLFVCPRSISRHDFFPCFLSPKCGRGLLRWGLHTAEETHTQTQRRDV